jgi:hypothetical protein
MSFPMVVAVFPLLLALLSLGSGLLVERGAGARLPAVLVPVCGFAALVVVSQFCTWTSPIAPATPWVLLGLAMGGFAVSWRSLIERWRARTSGWWLAPSAGLAAYLTVTAPILAAGRLTSTGYLLDTTGAIQLAGAERLLHHGHDFTNGFPGYGATLVAYFGNGYPSGGHTTLAAVGWLSGQDLFWLYTPFQAVALAFAALVLSFLASRAGLSRPAAAVTGWIAAVPALVYSYALMGSIKELTALPLLPLMGALVVLAPQLARAGIRAALPFAVTGAAAFGAIGIAASPWVGLFGLAVIVFSVGVATLGRNPWRMLAGLALTVGGLTAVLALPTLGPLSKTTSLATSLQSSNHAAAADPGNLVRPLRFVQTFGVWLGESHRVDPKNLNQTYLLIGVVIVCLVLGLIWLVRRRAWTLLTFFAISVVVWAFLTSRGTEWTNAKVLMLLSPAIVLVALVGAFGALGRRRLDGILLAGVLVLAVLGSDALTYHATGLAPTERYTELRMIGQRFAGQGPTLVTDFDEYAIYFLRSSRVNALGYAHRGPMELAGGLAPVYGHSYDIDQIASQTVQPFNLIVMRQSPEWSRPPGNYALAWSGPSWQVWRRVGTPPLLHVGLGETEQAVGTAPCRQIGRVASVAARHRALLRIASREPNIAVNLAGAAHSPNAVPALDPEGVAEFIVLGPMRLEAPFRVSRPARYRLWLGGTVDRPARALLDGRVVGSPSDVFGGDNNKYPVAVVSLSRGRHELEMIRGGGGLAPGDNASTVIDGAVFEPVSAERESLSTLAPSAWRSLCGRPLDWIEVS